MEACCDGGGDGQYRLRCVRGDISRSRSAAVVNAANSGSFTHIDGGAPGALRPRGGAPVGEEWRCLFAQYVLPFIRSRLFKLHYQLKNISWSSISL